MNRPHNKEYWYKELESHIRAIHNSSGQRKTILITGPHFYQVVTRVNHLSLKLWIDHVNALIKQMGSDRFEAQRFCWLTEQRKYRREFMEILKQHLQ